MTTLIQITTEISNHQPVKSPTQIPLVEVDPWAFLLSDAHPKLLRSDKIHYLGSKPLRDRFHLGIIGTRRPNRESSPFLKNLLQGLAKKISYRVISGGALGIDAQAHAEALKLKVPTYAWIVGDPALPTPHSNHRLFKHLQEQAGSAIITPEVLYRPKNVGICAPFWVERNYWIAANCDALLVVQAKKQSGTWWTVKACQEFDIPIYAVPGDPMDPCFEGTNLMISNCYANSVTSVDSLIEDLCRASRESAIMKVKESLRLSEELLERQ